MRTRNINRNFQGSRDPSKACVADSKLSLSCPVQLLRVAGDKAEVFLRQLIWCSLSQSFGGQRQNVQNSRGWKLWDPAGSVLGDRTSFRLRLIFYIKYTQDYNASFFVSYKLGSLKPLMYPEYSLAHNGYLLLVLSSRESRKSQM